MKYRDLSLSFSIEGVQFHTLNISVEHQTSPIPMHSHSKNSYEIHYISYGCGTLTTREQTYDILPGTLFVTGPQVEHEQISVTSNPMTEYCVYVKVSLPPKHHIPESSIIGQFLAHPFWFGLGDNTIHELMKQLLSELETREFGYELVLQTLLEQLILQLVRKYKSAEAVPTSRVAAINRGDLTYLTIEEAFLYDYRDITLERLAELVGLGTRQTERLLQMHYHKTFLQKKTEARMSAASSLLRGTDMKISEIATKLGYSSAEHFSNAFKHYYKKTASEYRRNRTQQE